MFYVNVPAPIGQTIHVEIYSSSMLIWNKTSLQWEGYLNPPQQYQFLTAEIAPGIYRSPQIDITAPPPAGETHMFNAIARDGTAEIVGEATFYLDSNFNEITAEEFAALAASGACGDITGIGSGTENFTYPDGSPAFTSHPNEGAGTRTVAFP
jgi:hypothetical protein